MTPPKGIKVSWPGDEKAKIEYAEILRLTGDMTVGWASLESHLVGVLQALVECDHDAATVVYYSPSSFSGRLAILRNLAIHVMPRGPEQRLLLRVFERIERLSKARNAFVHSGVYFVTDEHKRTSLNRHIFHPHKQEMRSEYRATANDIEHHIERLRAIWQLLYFMLRGETVSTIAGWEKQAFSTASAN